MIKAQTARLIVAHNKRGFGEWEKMELDKITDIIDKEIKKATENRVVVNLPKKYITNSVLLKELKKTVKQNGYSFSTTQEPRKKTRLKIILEWK